jgi:hypothetical protein
LCEVFKIHKYITILSVAWVNLFGMFSKKLL